MCMNFSCIAKILNKIPKGATIGLLFAITTYLYNAGIIGNAELQLISEISAVFGVAGSTITRLNFKK